MARMVDLVDVHGGAMADPVSLAAVAADDVEVALLVELCELLGR